MRIFVISLLSIMFLVVGCEQQSAPKKPVEIKLEKETKSDMKKTPDEEKKNKKEKKTEPGV